MAEAPTPTPAQGYCTRWDDHTQFQTPREIFIYGNLIHTVAGFVTHAVVNLHNTLMASENNRWVKIAGVVAMDLLLLPAAAIALAESALRLVLAILTSPLYFCCDGYNMIPASAAHSLGEFLNAFQIMYRTFTSNTTIDFMKNHAAIVKPMFCGYVGI